MSNLDNLTQKIVDDAKAEVDEIIKKATEQKEAVINSKINEAENEKKKIIEKSNNEAKLLKQRIISNAELKVRDLNLKTKREVLDGVVTEAKKRLNNIDEKQYVDFVDNSLKALELKGDEILVVQEGMEKKLKPAKNYPKISKEEYVDSGFVIKDENTTLNFTFESLIGYVREELESELVSILFDEQE